MRYQTHTGRLLLSLIAVTLSVGLASCEMPPQTQAPPEVAIAPQPDDADPSKSPAPNTTIGALIHRIDMPLGVSLDASWAQIDEQAVPMLMHGMWQANGLRVGILHADQAVAFAKTLPPIQGESRAKLFSSHYPTSVRSTPRLIGPITVDLTAPPRKPTFYRARDGRLQLLVRIGRSETGQAFVELTPHHYKQKPDLIPRSPLEKQLDGRVFHTLSVLLPVSPETAIVVGLNRPWPVLTDEPVNEEEPADSDAADTARDTTDANDNPEIDTPAIPKPPAIPEHLGRSLMTGMRAGQPTQIMLVISMIEEETAGDKQENSE